MRIWDRLFLWKIIVILGNTQIQNYGNKEIQKNRNKEISRYKRRWDEIWWELQRKVTFELAAAVKDESSLGLICRKGFNPDFSSLSHLHHFFSHLFPNFYFKISIYPTYKIPDSKFSPGPVLRFLRSAWLVLFLLLLLSPPPSFHHHNHHPLHHHIPPLPWSSFITGKVWSKWLPLVSRKTLFLH